MSWLSDVRTNDDGEVIVELCLWLIVEKWYHARVLMSCLEYVLFEDDWWWSKWYHAMLLMSCHGLVLFLHDWCQVKWGHAMSLMSCLTPKWYHALKWLHALVWFCLWMTDDGVMRSCQVFDVMPWYDFIDDFIPCDMISCHVTMTYVILTLLEVDDMMISYHANYII